MCPQAKQLRESPDSYIIGVITGVACRNSFRNRGCEADVLPHSLEKLPPETRRNTEETVRAISKAGYRVTKIVWDAELAHIVVHAGCGMFTVSCGPTRCTVTDTQGVEVELGDKVYARCKRTPPYLDAEYTKYF